MYTVASLRNLALEHGWHYREDEPSFADRWGAPPFDTWRGSKRAADVVSGSYRDHAVALFCLMTHDENYLVASLALTSRLPRFALVPLEGAVDADPFGLAFEAEDPGLAKTYEVYAIDADLAATVLHIDAVNALRGHRQMDWRIEGRDLLAIEPLGREFSEEDLTATLDVLVTVANGIPSGIYSRYPAPIAYPAA